MEVFKTITTSPKYEISNLGNIRTKKSGRILKTFEQLGYRRKKLEDKHGKLRSHRVHRLVFTEFVGEIPTGMVVDHINRNRSDNRVENLRIVSTKENTKNRKLTNKSSLLLMIYALYKNGTISRELLDMIIPENGALLKDR